jgi:hypothetical protein
MLRRAAATTASKGSTFKVRRPVTTNVNDKIEGVVIVWKQGYGFAKRSNTGEDVFYPPECFATRRPSIA